MGKWSELAKQIAATSECEGAGDNSDNSAISPEFESEMCLLKAESPPIVTNVTNVTGGPSPELPDEWVEGVCLLSSKGKPANVTDRWWSIVCQDAHAFLSSDWVLRAVDLGWSAKDLFGCHRESPEARFDAMGLVVAMNGKTLVALSEDSARLEARSGDRLRHNRRTHCPQKQIAPLWNLIEGTV